MPARGEVWWTDLGEPQGSEPAFVRPTVIVSADAYNRSRIATVVVAVVTSNLRLGDAPGNVVLRRGEAGLPKASVVNVTQVVTVDKDGLVERIGTLEAARLELVDAGLRRSLAL